MIKAIADIWARNCVEKYRIAQQCRADAAKMDPLVHPVIEETQRLLNEIAYRLERIG